MSLLVGETANPESVTRRAGPWLPARAVGRRGACSFDIDGVLLTVRAEADRLRRFVFRQELASGGSR